MAKYVARSGYFSFTEDDGTEHVLSSDGYISVDIDEGAETADLTASDDDVQHNEPYLQTLSMSVEMFEKSITTGNITWNDLSANMTGTVVFGVEGTASGKPKLTAPMSLTKIGQAVKHNDGVKRSLEFKSRGGQVTKSTWT